jgi:hypothetical protein
MVTPAIPRTMRAAAIDRIGPPAALTPGPKQFTQLERSIVDAKLRLPIAVYSLTRAAAAHARLERGHVPCRIVLQIRRKS